MDVVGLHLAQQVVGGLGLGDVDGLAGEGVHRPVGVLGVGVQAPQQVLEVDDAAHVVGVLPHHGHAGEAGEYSLNRLLLYVVLIRTAHFGNKPLDSFANIFPLEFRI